MASIEEQRGFIDSGIEDLRDAQRFAGAMGEKLDQCYDEDLHLARNALGVAIEQFRVVHTKLVGVTGDGENMMSKLKSAKLHFLSAGAAQSPDETVQALVSGPEVTIASMDEFNSGARKMTTFVENYLNLLNQVFDASGKLSSSIKANSESAQDYSNLHLRHAAEDWQERL